MVFANLIQRFAPEEYPKNLKDNFDKIIDRVETEILSNNPTTLIAALVIYRHCLQNISIKQSIYDKIIQLLTIKDDAINISALLILLEIEYFPELAAQVIQTQYSLTAKLIDYFVNEIDLEMEGIYHLYYRFFLDHLSGLKTTKEYMKISKETFNKLNFVYQKLILESKLENVQANAIYELAYMLSNRILKKEKIKNKEAFIAKLQTLSISKKGFLNVNAPILIEMLH